MTHTFYLLRDHPNLAHIYDVQVVIPSSGEISQRQVGYRRSITNSFHFFLDTDLEWVKKRYLSSMNAHCNASSPQTYRRG